MKNELSTTSRPSPVFSQIGRLVLLLAASAFINPTAHAAFGGAVAAGNFNGQVDGPRSTDEIVVGDPLNHNAGYEQGLVYVYVRNGTNSTDPKNWNLYFIDEGTFGGPRNDTAHFGSSFAVGDFDGDGLKDLAIGAPDEWVNGIYQAGAVYILFGRKAPVGDWPFDFWVSRVLRETEAYPDVAPATPGTETQFGAALAAGDFNGDGYDDLAIGAPGHEFDSYVGSGAVFVFHSDGPARTFSTINEYTFRVAGMWSNIGTLAGYQHFGSSLAVGNFNGDKNNGHPLQDLAVGIPGDWVNGIPGAGSVAVFYGSAGRLSASTPPQLWNGGNSTPGVSTEQGSAFGWAVAAGNFNAHFPEDGFDDLAVGSPYRMRLPNGQVLSQAGMVQVIYGGWSGLSPTGGQVWYPGKTDRLGTFAPGVSPQAFGRFGAALAAANTVAINEGNFPGDGYEPFELIIGEPGRTTRFLPEAGAVYVLRGSPAGQDSSAPLGGLISTRSQQFDDGTSGSAFGSALATGNFGLHVAQEDPTFVIDTDFLAAAPGERRVNVHRGDRTFVHTKDQSLSPFPPYSGP